MESNHEASQVPTLKPLKGWRTCWCQYWVPSLGLSLPESTRTHLRSKSRHRLLFTITVSVSVSNPRPHFGPSRSSVSASTIGKTECVHGVYQKSWVWRGSRPVDSEHRPLCCQKTVWLVNQHSGPVYANPRCYWSSSWQQRDSPASSTSGISRAPTSPGNTAVWAVVPGAWSEQS